ncbi:MAG: carbamoyltransferase HypF [Alphaproteobacteria bacterium]
MRAENEAVLVEARTIRIRGLVQGVGFRPTLWRLAEALGLKGEIGNDTRGVRLDLEGDRDALDRLIRRIEQEAPPLARIDAIEQQASAATSGFGDLRIVASGAGEVHTFALPDAAICAACLGDVLDPFDRRYRYPFTNCTHCGPRFSILRAMPYDRAETSMASFAMCADCAAEYENPADRRFHAQPNACHACGPKVELRRMDGRAMDVSAHSMLDAVDAVASLIQKGEIVAIKGLGGFHLACDATNGDAVARLRERKKRDAKPFALMVRDLEVARRFVRVSPDEARLLGDAAAPIVLLEPGERPLPEEIAPGMATLGIMLPYTPLHHLIFRRLDRPAVMTSGNRADEPQCITDADALERLAGIADYVLLHDREIVNRVDDSVVRVMAGAPRTIRRARGFAPEPMPLPAGFERAPDLLAMGGELKAVFCLLKDGQAILSPHQGDLEEARTQADCRHQMHVLAALFDHRPEAIAVDLHPEYFATKLGQQRAEDGGLPALQIQHHHAHIASCMAENGLPRDTEPVLGVALDGLGLGADGTIWGGEFLLADYQGFERLGCFKPVAMPGGDRASQEPWRNLYAHLMAEMGWPRFAMNFSELDLFQKLDAKPRATLDAMLSKNLNSPLASSAGRLFDAVAAALGLCFERVAFEGQAAMALEAIVDRDALETEDELLAYPFAIPNLGGRGMPYIEPLGMWEALLGDLILKTPPGVIAARFHRGLAKAIAGMVAKLIQRPDGRTIGRVALSGGVFQNRILLEQCLARLAPLDIDILTQSRVPANDGGLALGQAAIAAARLLER